MKKIKILMTVLCAALLVMGMVSSASALPVNITSATPWVASGSETGVPQIEDAIMLQMGWSVMPAEAYKGNTDGTEAGLFASSYQTAYGAGNETATITWVGPSIIGLPAWLLVKDGNNVPQWRLYDLSALNWTGTELITLGQLWPGTGSYSHVVHLQ